MKSIFQTRIIVENKRRESNKKSIFRLYSSFHYLYAVLPYLFPFVLSFLVYFLLSSLTHFPPCRFFTCFTLSFLLLFFLPSFSNCSFSPHVPDCFLFVPFFLYLWCSFFLSSFYISFLLSVLFLLSSPPSSFCHPCLFFFFLMSIPVFLFISPCLWHSSLLCLIIHQIHFCPF